MTNIKKIDLAALLEEDAVDVTKRRPCHDMDCLNFALQNSAYCARHSETKDESKEKCFIGDGVNCKEHAIHTGTVVEDENNPLRAGIRAVHEDFDFDRFVEWRGWVSSLPLGTYFKRVEDAMEAVERKLFGGI